MAVLNGLTSRIECQACGESEALRLPATPDAAIAHLREFEARHRHDMEPTCD